MGSTDRLASKHAALEARERRLLRIVEGKPADDNVVPFAGPTGMA